MNNTNNKEASETLIVLITASIILSLVFKNQYFIYAGIVLGTVGIFSNYLTVKIHFLWMQLAKYLSKISTTLLLFLLYFIILVPLAFLRKKSTMNTFLVNDANLQSTFIKKNKIFNEESLKNMW